MQTELPPQVFAAIATTIAALVAAAISFINLTLNKEQKTSEFRQAWIDGLREDLSSFFACARAFSRATDEYKAFGPNKENTTHLAMTGEKISEIRYQVAETRYRIQLRLNLGEPEHTELFRLMQCAIDAQQNENTAATLMAIEAAAGYAPQILKSEWKRVKRGGVCVPRCSQLDCTNDLCSFVAFHLPVSFWSNEDLTVRSGRPYFGG